MTNDEQAKRSNDPVAALALLETMENWSEDRFYASWHRGLARMVDQAMAGGYAVGDGVHQIDAEDLADLTRLRKSAGGTWVFDGDQREWRRFVTNAEWDAMGNEEPFNG